MNAALELIGFAAGSEAGARLARALGLIVSPDTLLRRLRQTAQEEATTPRIIGVDDFAFRRAPAAVQVADRWHLLKNLREALEKLLKRQLRRKRQRQIQRICPSVADETKRNDFLEGSRVRL